MSERRPSIPSNKNAGWIVTSARPPLERAEALAPGLDNPIMAAEMVACTREAQRVAELLAELLYDAQHEGY